MDWAEEFDFLLGRLAMLHEVEDASEQAGQMDLARGARKLYRSTFRRLRSLVQRLLKRHPSLGAARTTPPIESLEFIFQRLRDQAEMEGSRASKGRGKRAKRKKADAKEITRLTRLAARSLKIEAERRGIWNEAYSKEYGLEKWLRIIH